MGTLKLHKTKLMVQIIDPVFHPDKCFEMNNWPTQEINVGKTEPWIRLVFERESSFFDDPNGKTEVGGGEMGGRLIGETEMCDLTHSKWPGTFLFCSVFAVSKSARKK